MSQDYSPSLVTKNLVFCGDAAMKSAAGPATLLYDKVNDNNGTMYNGSCLDFDGTDDYVEIATTYEPGNGNWALSMWINTDTWGTYSLMGNTSGGPSASRYFVGPSLIGFSNYDGAWQHHYGNTTLSLSTWYFCTWVNYAGSSSSNGTMKMFVNGVADSSAVNSYTTNGGRLNAIGQNTASYFDGRIADVRFYNVALSDANVKELYDDSKVIIPTKNDASGGFAGQTNLKRWWTFAEGAGTICYDALGYTKYATMTNMTSADWLTGQTGAPQLVEGYNRKLLFSGDDYVDCGNNSSLNFTTSNFSISCWVYIHDLTDVGYIVRRGGWGSNGWYTYLDSSGRVQIYTNDSGQGDPHTQTQSNSSVITANTWHHVVWVRNGATGVIYVDGTDETASGDSMIDPATSTNTCYIGSATNYISGIVDEVIVYDTVVTSSQAAALHATDANGGPLPPDPMSGASSLPSTSNVVSYWRNDGESTWADRGNNSNDGTPAGTPTTLLFKQGINGQKNVNTGRDNQGFPLLYQNNGAIGLDGVKDYVNITPALDWSDFPYVTTSLWVQTNFTGAQNYAFLSWANASNSGGVGMNVNSSGYFYVSYRDNAYVSGSYPTLTDTTSTINDGEWHQCVFTYGGDSAIYVDGVLVGSASRGSTMYDISSELTYIGHLANHAVGNYHFDGRVANLQIYNRALTYAEIQQNYNSFKARFVE